MKITTAVITGPGRYSSVQATAHNIDGITVAIHPSLSGAGFAATDPRTGYAYVSKAKSKRAALDVVRGLVERYGVDGVDAVVSKYPAAPPVGELVEWVTPTKSTKPDLDAIVAAIAGVVELTDAERAAVRAALSSTSGRLRAKSPSAFGGPDEQLAAAAWQGLQPNGYKIGVVTVWSLRGPALELYTKLSAKRWPSALDADRAKLEAYGVW